LYKLPNESAAHVWPVLPEVPQNYAITHDEVHVWRTCTGWRSGQISAVTGILSPDELRKAERFRLEADYERHVIGRALTRIALGRLLDRAPATLRFRYNDFGKPRLADVADECRLGFNISHSGELVLVALSAQRAIGVDVEFSRKNLNVEEIAAHFFSALEHATLMALPSAQRPDAFFRCWTRKEAFIKARGEGLSLPLNGFDVTLRPNEPPMLLATRPDAVEAGRWVIRELEVGPD
jgi:4'-phosphopantetheinyl transferase